MSVLLLLQMLVVMVALLISSGASGEIECRGDVNWSMDGITCTGAGNWTEIKGAAPFAVATDCLGNWCTKNATSQCAVPTEICVSWLYDCTIKVAYGGC